MHLAERVLRTVRTHGLWGRGGRVVAALSGGADSVAMVHLLRELERLGELTLAGVAHFNHQLRESADADEAFCRGIAEQFGVPFDAGRGDVRERARLEGRSVEDAARASRYDFLERAADRAGAGVIAVAHSLDDQAETFLLRLLRGAGPRGLAGILPRAGRVVRPLLDVRRAELREYLAARQIAFREDETNADVAIPRNRVRHELIPYLAAWFSPGITDVLAREAAIAREDEDLLQIQAIDLASLIVLRKEADQNTASATTRIDAARLTTLHPAMAARVARVALEQASSRYIGFDQIARLLAFARDARPGAALSLPGLRAMRDARGIVLGAARSRPPSPPESNSFRFPLSIPGEVRLDSQGWVISAGSTDVAGVSGPAHAGPQGAPQTPPEQGGSVPVRSGSLKLPLAVRFRRPGDRLKPGGMGGRRKKLQDLFVDRKIPREIRDSVPLVVDDDDRIVWVVGEGVAEDFRVTAPSQGVIFLKARRLGGLG